VAAAGTEVALDIGGLGREVRIESHEADAPGLGEPSRDGCGDCSALGLDVGEAGGAARGSAVVVPVKPLSYTDLASSVPLCRPLGLPNPP